MKKNTLRFKNCILSSILMLLFLGFFLSGCKKNKFPEVKNISESEKLIVGTFLEKEIYEPIIKEFEERSGIWVQVVEGKKCFDYADVMFGGAADFYLFFEDIFEPYKTVQFEKLEKKYSSSKNLYTVFSQSPLVFIYNQNLSFSGKIPHSFKELLDFSLFGHIAFANPNLSSSSFQALYSIVQVLSPEFSQQEIIRKFTNNLNNDICKNQQEIIEQICSGKKQVGIVFEDAALKIALERDDIKIVYPEDVNICPPQVSGIFKKAEHKKNAELFVEFLVCLDVQNFIEEKLSMRSVRIDLQKRKLKNEISYDFVQAAKERSQILDLWNQASGK